MTGVTVLDIDIDDEGEGDTPTPPPPLPSTRKTDFLRNLKFCANTFAIRARPDEGFESAIVEVLLPLTLLPLVLAVELELELAFEMAAEMTDRGVVGDTGTVTETGDGDILLLEIFPKLVLPKQIAVGVEGDTGVIDRTLQSCT